MNCDANVWCTVTACRFSRGASWWMATGVYGVLIAATGLLVGCAGDVAMQNPRTGATVTCPGNHRELDPWSQTMACVANYEAQGWTRAGPE
jgi:hypothetical protein